MTNPWRSGWWWVGMGLVFGALFTGVWLLDRNVGLRSTLRIRIDDPWRARPYVRAFPAGAFVTTIDTRGASVVLAAERAIPIRFRPPRTYHDLSLTLIVGASEATAAALVFPGPVGQPAQAELLWHRELATLDWPTVQDGTLTLYQHHAAPERFASVADFQAAAQRLPNVASLLVEPPVGRPLDFDAWSIADVQYLLVPTPRAPHALDGGTFSSTLALAALGNDHRTYTIEIRTAAPDLLAAPLVFRELELDLRGDALVERALRAL